MDPMEFFPIYYDSEFTGLHRDTRLISIGLITDGGDYFYAEFNDFPKDGVSDWIKDHVIANLLYNQDEKLFMNERSSHNMHYSVRMKGNTGEVSVKLNAWLQNESAIAGKKIQIYSDCYAYDWMLFNDLVCENGDALKLPQYVYYIPVDLSTVLQACHIDPDITREDFIEKDLLDGISAAHPFCNMGVDTKHNSLWDAVVCQLCFMKLRKFM